jgi:hypothetical protein
MNRTSLVNDAQAGTLNGQPGVEDFEAGSMGEKLSAPPESGYVLASHWYSSGTRGPKENPPW